MPQYITFDFDRYSKMSLSVSNISSLRPRANNLFVQLSDKELFNARCGKLCGNLVIQYDNYSRTMPSEIKLLKNGKDPNFEDEKNWFPYTLDYLIQTWYHNDGPLENDFDDE